MPLLVVVTDIRGRAADVGLIAFPSLFRGGLHHAELAGAAQVSHPDRELRRLNDVHAAGLLRRDPAANHLVDSVRVSLSGGSGTEPIFAADFGQWMRRVCGVGLSALSDPNPETPGEAYLGETLGQTSSRRNGQYTLDIPCDSIPTIAVLAAGPRALQEGPVSRAGHYFVADRPGARPRLSVQLPESMDQLLPLQPEWTNGGMPRLDRLADGPSSGDQAPLPHVAIRMPVNTEQSRAAMLMPLAPDSSASVLPSAPDARIDVVIRVTSPGRLATALRALLAQDSVHIAHVRADIAGSEADETEIAGVLAAEIPGRGSVRTLHRHAPIGKDCLVDGSGSAFTLVMDDDVLLHDNRTLAALAGMAGAERAATASCAIIREAAARKSTALAFESGGYFPSHVSLLASPRLILALPDIRSALPLMTYPVVANHAALVLLNTAAVIAVDSGDAAAHSHAAPTDVIAFSLRALAHGYRHLCTTAVRAAVLGTPKIREAIDPPGTECLSLEHWSEVLSAVTVIRNLH
jgi:hypothetical protein